MIDLSTDGDRTITARIRGVVTILGKILGSGFFRVLCGFHQLDLVMQSKFEAAFDESFLFKLIKLISYLWRRSNLVALTRREFSKIYSVRWLSVGKVIDWLALHQTSVQDFLVQKAVSWASEDSYWIFF